MAKETAAYEEKMKKTLASHVNVRCIILPYRKRAKTRVECRPGLFR